MKYPYAELRDPRWQRRRLEVMAASNFTCVKCGDASTTLNVNHKVYHYGKRLWEYVDTELECLCEPCHEAISRKPKPLVPPLPFPSHMESLLHKAQTVGLSRAERSELSVLLLDRARA